MAMAASGHCLYLFGGVGAAGTESILDVSNDLWCFDTVQLQWSRIDADGPRPSPRRCVGWVEFRGALVLWGGSGIQQTPDGRLRYDFRNDLWRFSPATRLWMLMRDTDDHLLAPFPAPGRPVAPPPRYTPVVQPVGRKMFLFGGYTEDRLGKRQLNDAWVLDGDSWAEIPKTGPEGRAAGARWPGLRYGCMSACSDRSVFVCGGFSDEGDHIDLWCLDPEAMTWGLLAADQGADGLRPLPRYCAAMAHFDGRLVLFGGRSRRDAKLNFNDLWIFDVAAGRWECVCPNREPHRYDASAEYPAYHAKSASAVLGTHLYIWGGEGRHGHVSDFWRLDLRTLRWDFLQAARADDPIFW